jgi:hypothetical protein
VVAGSVLLTAVIVNDVPEVVAATVEPVSEASVIVSCW